MNKSKKVLSLVILSIILIVAAIIYDGFNYAPARIKVNYQSVKSDKLHKDLEMLQIAFISDIHYNNFMDAKRFENVVKKINEANPDVIIFLGDLIDEENSHNLSDEIIEKLISQLKEMDAKYGKFAVLGEADYQNQFIEETVVDILFKSEFEIMRNEMYKLSQGTKETFQLVAIDSPLNKKDDIKKAYEQLDDQQFTLTIVHTPDTVNDLPQTQTDLVVAGHSHGGQVKIPLLGQLYNKKLAEEYYSGLYNVGSIKLYVTNGVGTSNTDVRIFAPAEITVFTLKHK